MEIQQIPLQERLEAVSRRNPAHAEYIPALFRAFAAMPIRAYLSEYPEDLKRLTELVSYPDMLELVSYPYMPGLTYLDAIMRIRDMRRIGMAAEEALEILAKPMIGLYRKPFVISEPF